MPSKAKRATAEALVGHCRAGTEREALATLYHPDAVSVEAAAMPGSGSAETRGLAGIEGKQAWWQSAMQVHESTVEGPYFHGADRFAVTFRFDVTDRHSGARRVMREVAIYTVDADARIVREEFFSA